MSNMELKSKSWVWDKNLGLNSTKIVITHVGMDRLPPGDTMSEMNIVRESGWEEEEEPVEGRAKKGVEAEPEPGTLASRYFHCFKKE